MPVETRERIVPSAGVELSVSDSGEGAPVVLLHGLTATRRYVVMGSRALERGGHRVIAYDARGHGRSTPAPRPEAYGYETLAADLLAVLDAFEIERALIAGASMGAHTAARLALEHPERVAALALITPAFDPRAGAPAEALAAWDALSDGLREGGVEGFVTAYEATRTIAPAYRDNLLTVLRQRLGAHEHPEAVADALRAVPRSWPFQSLDELAALTVPTLVVGDRDEADPEHPLAVARTYAATIPDAGLEVEPEGRSPLAWQGGQLSRLLAELAARAAF